MRLKASFTIEASYIIAIIMFTVSTGLICAFRMRDEVVSQFVTHAASVDGAYTEEEWIERESNLSNVNGRALRRLHAVGSLSNLTVNTERSESNFFEQGKSTATLSGGKNTEITGMINDPEEYMRAKSILDDWVKEREDAKEGEINER